MSIGGREQAMAAVAAVAARSLADAAKRRHGTLAEASHTAALAADRLRAAAVGQGVGVSEISLSDLEAVLAMMRDIQNKTHLAFLAAHGTEADYQAAGRQMARRYPAPSRRARKSA